jgi:hypothetical protein
VSPAHSLYGFKLFIFIGDAPVHGGPETLTMLLASGRSIKNYVGRGMIIQSIRTRPRPQTPKICIYQHPAA